MMKWVKKKVSMSIELHGFLQKGIAAERGRPVTERGCWWSCQRLMETAHTVKAVGVS